MPIKNLASLPLDPVMLKCMATTHESIASALRRLAQDVTMYQTMVAEENGNDDSALRSL